MVTTACPSADELKNYVLGRLSEQDWAVVAKHLESCPHCQAAIATVDDLSDTLLTQLRQPEPVDSFLNESQCEAALMRARDIKGATGFQPVMGATGFQPVQSANTGKMPVVPVNSTGKMPVPRDVELEGYCILEELGQGGMGAVYKALHTKLDRVVAIKILSRARAGDERAIARFEREMKAVGRFDHPHIVRAYDARAGAGVPPVLIMEFVEGMDLGHLVRRLGPLPVADACELVRQTAVGLQYIHEHGLVHRDIKPSNLMLTPQGTMKILDLGLARFHFGEKKEEEKGTGSERSEVPVPFSDMTHSGQAMGTADYMAPEQASDSHAVDIRADIYSLGCTFYKLLSGSAPFEASQYKGTFDKMTAHVQQPVAPIETLLPEIPRALSAILGKMLAKDPADRFAQPAEVAETLTPFCKAADLVELNEKAATADQDFVAVECKAATSGRATGESIKPIAQSSRRRTSILAAVGLLLFALGFGLGYRFGILVTIKKDGKTTEIEVPEGSNVHITDQGNVMIDQSIIKPADTVGSEPYKILPGDVLHITIEEGSMIDGDFEVDSSGMLDLSAAQIKGIYGDKEWVVKHFKNLEPISVQELDLAQATKRIRLQLGRIFDFLPKTVLTFDRKSLEKRTKSERQTPLQSRYITEKQETTERHPPEKRRQRYTADMVPVPDSYRLAPGDTLVVEGGMKEIRHFGESNGGIIEVAGNGTITIDKIFGPVKVEGMTLDEAEFAAKKRIIEVCFNPDISIKLIESGKSSTNSGDSESYRLAEGDKVDLRISVTPASSEFHEECRVSTNGLAGYGKWNIVGLTLKEAEKKLLGVLRSEMKGYPYVSITLVRLRNAEQNPPAQRRQRYTADMQPVPDSYRLSPGDRIVVGFNGSKRIGGGNPFYVGSTGEIRLIGDPVNDSKYGQTPSPYPALNSVGPYYNFMDYGELDVQGMTLEEAESAIAKRIKDVWYNPKVAIELLDDSDRPKADINRDSYHIAPGDKLRFHTPLTIDPISSTQVISTVQPDGDVQIRLSLATIQLSLGGITLKEAEKSVRDNLIAKFETPKVTVQLYTLKKAEQNPPQQQELKQEIHRIDLSAGKADLPPEPYTIMPGDVLLIRVAGALADQPIDNYYLVEPAGTVLFGPAYGRVKVQGLSLVEAEKAIQKSLQEILRNPEVSVTLSAWVDRSAPPSPLPNPYIIGCGDTLHINAVGTIPDQPINGFFVVEPMGTVALPPAYFRVKVQGLTIEQAEKAVEKSLSEVLRQPEVSIALALWQDPAKYKLPHEPPHITPGDILSIWVAGTIPDQPIHGPYLVESDGQVALGPAYGRVNLKGQTFEEAEKTVTKKLQEILREPQVSITMEGWRKSQEMLKKADDLHTYRVPKNISVQPLKQTKEPAVKIAPPLSSMPSKPGSELDKYLSPNQNKQGLLIPLEQEKSGEKQKNTVPASSKLQPPTDSPVDQSEPQKNSEKSEK